MIKVVLIAITICNHKQHEINYIILFYFGGGGVLKVNLIKTIIILSECQID